MLGEMMTLLRSVDVAIFISELMVTLPKNVVFVEGIVFAAQV